MFRWHPGCFSHGRMSNKRIGRTQRISALTLVKLFVAFANAALTASAVAQSPLPTLAPPAIKLAWYAETNLMVAGYKIHIGYASQSYVASLDVSNTTSGSL